MTGEKTLVYQHDVPSYDTEAYSINGWVRGVAYDRNSHSIFVAADPGVLLHINCSNYLLLDRYELLAKRKLYKGKGLQPCPFGVVLDPRDWGHCALPKGENE